MGLQKHGAEDIGCFEVMMIDWLNGRIREEGVNALGGILRWLTVLFSTGFFFRPFVFFSRILFLFQGGEKSFGSVPPCCGRFFRLQ